MIRFTFAAILIALSSSAASANTYVICGETANFETQTVTGYELELSSEGTDDYSGPVGSKWNMKLESQDSQWLTPNRKIVARNYKSGADTIVEISIASGRSASGPVGTMYKLIGLYDEEPRLEKYTMGGFAGTVKIGTYQCYTGND